MVEPILQDTFGRRFETLRVSVTDRCNFRCAYCMPEEGMEWFPRAEILSFEELARMVRIGVSLGLRRVHLTGGEPLLRRDLPDLVRMVSGIPGVEDLSLTTNGVLLPELAERLAAAGLRRVNVSLDSFDRETFRRIARRDLLPRVLEAIEVARRTFSQVKVNAVLVRGMNDTEPPRFAAFARETGVAVRFIEYMPLDGGSGWGIERVVPGREARERIEADYPLIPRVPAHAAQPSRDYVFADGAPGEVGFINPITEPFCARCDRMRLTADGKLKNCMFDRGEVDVRGPLRAGASDDAIRELLRRCARAKGPGGLLEIGSAEAYVGLRTMSRLGG